MRVASLDLSVGYFQAQGSRWDVSKAGGPNPVLASLAQVPASACNSVPCSVLFLSKIKLFNMQIR